MSVLYAVLCGVIQGVCEFLPVSSSGHLALFQNIFGMENFEGSYLTFNVLLHFGTLLAVFIVYWKDIFELVPAFFTLIRKFFGGKRKLCDYNTAERMVIFVIVACLPMLIVPFFDEYVEGLSASTLAVGIILILNGGLLFISDSLSRGSRDASCITSKNAFAVGVCQLFAVLPGLSRSGSTITGGLTQGFSREFAVKFSFILSIPAILGANIFKLPDIFGEAVSKSDITAYAVGIITALICGIAAMKLLIYISKKSNFRYFSFYCWAVGAAAIIFDIIK